MADGIHYLMLNRAKAQHEQVKAELLVARKQLAEAVEMGDLRENSEYDAAKDAVGKLTKEAEALQPVMTMAAVRANDGLAMIREGAVIDLTVHQLTKSPIKPGTSEFEKLKEQTPVFHGVLAFGASLSIHELLNDKVLKVGTPVGAFLLGKRPGDYSIPVPGGFSNVTVSKVFNVEDAKVLHCTVGGVDYAETI